MAATMLCVATKKGHEVVKEALASRPAGALIVCVISEPRTAEPFDDAIRKTAQESQLPIVAWSSFRAAPEETLERWQIGAIMCIGWRYLIPPQIVERLKGEIIIAHDSLLPRLRGFAPLPTALIAGHEETGVTYLRAGRGVDDGDVLWQQAVPIGATDTIADLIDKVCPLYREGARRYFEGRLKQGIPQDHSQATYSLWRDELDYRIDWTQDAVQIERTIRALGRPYPGAQTMLAGELIVLHQAELVTDLDFAIRQPGKIWSLDAQGRPTIVCGKGLLKVTRATTLQGADILPLASLRQRLA